MQILVTGASGFLGQNLLDVLVARPEKPRITCLVRTQEQAAALAERSPQITPVLGDLTVPESIQTLPVQVDLVFHLAAKMGLGDGPGYDTVNVGGTEALLLHLQGSETLKRLVYVSSWAAIGRPVNARPPLQPLDETMPTAATTDYGRSKWEAEQRVIQSGLPYVVFRPAFLYGPYMHAPALMHKAIEDVALDNPYTRFPFSGAISEMDAGDLAEVLWHGATTPACLGQTYFAANRQPVAVQHVFKTIYQAMQKPYRAYPIPRLALGWLKHTMKKEGLSPLLADTLFEPYFTVNPAKLYSHISYRPYYGFEAGLTRTIRWYQQQGRLPQKNPSVQPGLRAQQ